MKGTASKSTDEGRQGRLPLYQTCSIRVRSRKTSGLTCGATSRKAGNGCVGRMDRGFSLFLVHDPEQHIYAAERVETGPEVV
jgi:hypothetical protein